MTKERQIYIYVICLLKVFMQLDKKAQEKILDDLIKDGEKYE